MSAPIAFLNGQFAAADQLKVSVVDAGFVQGVTVAEQIRTFGGQLFRLEQHLARLQQGVVKKRGKAKGVFFSWLIISMRH